MFLWWCLTVAQATDVEATMARVHEIAPLRAQRLQDGVPAHDASVYRKAAAGQIQTGVVPVEGHKAKKVWGVGVVDVPIDAYWAAVNDDPSKVAWTKLEYLEIVQGEACQAPRRVFQFLPIPLVTDRWWLIDIRYNEALAAGTQGRVREQTWATNGDFTPPSPTTRAWSEKGMAIARTEGSWFLVDLDGAHTLVEYYTWADPGGSLPAGLASSLAANGVDNTITQLAALAKQGPSCTPKDAANEPPADASKQTD